MLPPWTEVARLLSGHRQRDLGVTRRFENFDGGRVVDIIRGMKLPFGVPDDDAWMRYEAGRLVCCGWLRLLNSRD